MTQTITNKYKDKISYQDTPEIRDKVFEKVMKFFKERDCFVGEVICQNDDCQMYAYEYFASIADNILKFEVEYSEE